MDEQKKTVGMPENAGKAGHADARPGKFPEAEIPFMDDFKAVMLTGAKTATSRNKIYGHPGQTFRAFGARFRILALFRLTQAVVRDQHYRAEGFTSPEAFEACWAKLHPRAGFQPDKPVWMHTFTKEART